MKALLPNLVAVILFFFISAAYSQSNSKVIRGKVVDKTKQPLEHAVVKVKSGPDSLTSVTAKDGSFVIRNVKAGAHTVKVSFIGYKPYTSNISISATASEANLGEIVLEEGLELDEVTVEADPEPVKVKTDTIEYNAAAFKTQPNAVVEDLLKKLPGLEVDKDGKLKAQGEAITKVTVDGKEFFGSDPKIATKNLPADAIAKAQVIDEKSEKTKATGVDDGTREKVLNLVLKKDKKKGSFGNASLSGGTASRYSGSLSLNHYNKEKQMNILLMSNNTNQTGFSMEDAGNFGGEGRSYTMGQDGTATLSSMNGVNVGGGAAGSTETLSGGVNFSNAWGKKKQTKLNVSYFGFGSSTLQETESRSEIQQPSGVFYGESRGWNDNSSETHRVNLLFTSNPDSLTTIRFSPSVSLAWRNGQGEGRSDQRNGENAPINDTWNVNSNSSFSPFINGNYSINRRLRNKKGSISLYVYNYSSGSNSENIQKSENNYYQTNRKQEFNREEQRDYSYSNLNISPTVTRVVSKDKKSSLNFSTNYSLSNDNSSSGAYEYNPVTGFYERFIDSLAAETKSRTQTLRPEFGYSRYTDKWNITASATVQKMFLDGNIYSRGERQEVSENYLNFLPYIYLGYRPKKSTNIRFYASTNASAPYLGYLQVNQTNANPLYINYGNPDLKASKSISSNLSYNISNPVKGSFSNISLSYRYTLDATVRSTYFDENTGITYSKPINLDGNYNLNINGSFSIPTKVKGLRFSPGFGMGSSRNKGYLNNLPNNSDQLNAGPSLNLSYAYKEIVDITMNNRVNFTYVNNSVQTAADRRFFNIDNGASLSLRPLKKWRINTDVTQRSYAGQGFTLMNAGLQRFFMKNDRLSAELKGFDLFNRNSDVRRYVSNNSINDTRSNNIGRYFYLRLTYKVTKIGASPSRQAVPAPVIMF